MDLSLHPDSANNTRLLEGYQAHSSKPTWNTFITLKSRTKTSSQKFGLLIKPPLKFSTDCRKMVKYGYLLKYFSVQEKLVK